MIYGIPSSFGTSHNSEDIAALLSTNSDNITSVLQYAEFLTHACTSNQVHHKMHALLILHFTDPETANNCINYHISY